MGTLIMKKNVLLLIIPIFLGSLLILNVLFAKTQQPEPDSPMAVIDGTKVKIEIADTVEKRKNGLMLRKFMPKNNGMLFIFDKLEKPVFWMKDCFIPLDIIFIRNNKIVNMYHSVPPCKEDPCELYPSIEYVDSALEVNAGFAQKHKIKINDKIEIKGLSLQ